MPAATRTYQGGGRVATIPSPASPHPYTFGVWVVVPRIPIQSKLDILQGMASVERLFGCVKCYRVRQKPCSEALLQIVNVIWFSCNRGRVQRLRRRHGKASHDGSGIAYRADRT